MHACSLVALDALLQRRANSERLLCRGDVCQTPIAGPYFGIAAPSLRVHGKLHQCFGYPFSNFVAGDEHSLRHPVKRHRGGREDASGHRFSATEQALRGGRNVSSG